MILLIYILLLYLYITRDTDVVYGDIECSFVSAPVGRLDYWMKEKEKDKQLAYHNVRLFWKVKTSLHKVLGRGGQVWVLG